MATFVMILVLNIYKVVLSFEKISMFESLFLGNVLKLCCEVCLKIARMFCKF